MGRRLHEIVENSDSQTIDSDELWHGPTHRTKKRKGRSIDGSTTRMGPHGPRGRQASLRLWIVHSQPMLYDSTLSWLKNLQNPVDSLQGIADYLHPYIHGHMLLRRFSLRPKATTQKEFRNLIDPEKSRFQSDIFIEIQHFEQKCQIAIVMLA